MGKNGIAEKSTMSKVFVDTNILVYTLDNYNLAKQEKCRSLLKILKDGKGGVISTQILQEFYVVCVGKLKLDPLLVKSILHSLTNFEVVTVDTSLIEAAIDCNILTQISFWDALVVVSAERARCAKVWTEDLNHGQVLRSVTIENPFLA